ncbi:unnamed protein product [Arabidopsis arenosa]|uniref:Protein kinase domain-containing protein n=1 Tax=Arabidopsis arenosa TaxID=38785 RepID=A0A8S2AK11_ARAAE|nr:unnamed protein product [Arabidopsis arenosa]
MEENTGAQGLQVDACVVLALRCCAESNEDRPKMIQREIPEGDSGVQDICGTTGFVETQYSGTGFVNENVDIYNLSADDDIPDHSKLQMEAFVDLALRCVRFRPGETKLHMIDVAKYFANIVLDENWSVKLSSFSLSILNPEGETGVNDMVCRTSRYIEPDYFNTGLVTENVDIYSLGIIMLVLLTGKSEYNSEVAVYLPVLPVYVGKFTERGLSTATDRPVDVGQCE